MVVVDANLEKFKKLSANPKNHPKLLSDKKAILYAATKLINNNQDENCDILKLCLDIFENFLENPQTHVALITTFGIYEAVESLAIKTRFINEEIFKRAKKITGILRDSSPPAYNTRSKNNKKIPTVFLLFIPNLTQQMQPKLENILKKLKGIISFLIDMEMKRCTLRICANANIKEIVEKIYAKCKLQCLIVKKRPSEAAESFYDILLDSSNKSYLEYFDDNEEFNNKSRAIIEIEKNPLGNSKFGLFESVKNFCTESFYW